MTDIKFVQILAEARMNPMHCQCKVDVPDSVAYLNWTHNLECYVVRFGSKKGYQKDMGVKEFRQCAQNMVQW